jgi:4-hydroxyphenylpyruvate dioxygenase
MDNFHHITIWVGSANATKERFINKFGFKQIAVSCPQTGNKETTSYLMQQDKVLIVISSPLGNKTFDQLRMNKYLARHGDGVRDIAFTVSTDLKVFKHKLQTNGASFVQDDKHLMTIQAHQTHSSVTHTFFKETHNPFSEFQFTDDKTKQHRTPMFIDHVVANMRDEEMDLTVEWYNRVLGLDHYMSFDDSQIHTEFSSLRSKVMANHNLNIKLPINEPAAGKKKSQIQEFIDENDGPGIQHIALNVPQIIPVIREMKKNGMQFTPPPPTYYDDMRKHASSIKENYEELEELGILLDFDDKGGYLLQIFTEPVFDRATLFFEIIQREENNGFGAGNFKALFQSIEKAQKERGNLVPYEKPPQRFPPIYGLHHFAYKCKNLDQTIEFYRDILHLPYVHRIDKSYVPSTKEYAPYTHIFFQLADGSFIAFFDTYDDKIANYDCDKWINHIAFSVGSLYELQQAKEKLQKLNIDVIGPTNHDGFITSIYFFDPNGLRLELTYQQATKDMIDRYAQDCLGDI